MNYRGQTKYVKLEVCPKCGTDSGSRKVTTKDPEKYYVVCEYCGHKTHPHNTQRGATREWNYSSSKRARNEEQV